MSCSRSINSEMTPSAVDCQIVWASTPVNTKCSRLIFEESPNPDCRLEPRMPMKMSGNAKSDTMRARSRSSLMRSRCASVRTAATSLTDFAHYLEIRVLEARHVRAYERQRRVDRLERGVRVARVDVDAERPAAVTAQLETRELVAQPPAVLGIDEDVLLHQVGLDALRRTERDDLALVDDADRVGL